MSGLADVEPRMTGAVRLRDGVQLAFSMFGTGTRPQRATLIHSLALDRGVWSQVVPHLVDEADVLTFDCRGHGASGTGTPDFTTEQLADDLAELLDALGWSNTLVAGCSMGGAVAQQFAASHRDRVRGSVFIDTTAWYGPEAPKTWRERADKARTDGFGELLPFQLARWFGEDYAQANKAVVDSLTKTFLANDLDAYGASCRLLGDADLRPIATQIAQPVAVVVGSEDYATPPEMARELADSVNGSLTVLSGAKHLTPLERSAEIAKVIIDTLEQDG
ncbi:MAG: alpha/beta fold hydrolase [Streptosporangiales bacterium]|nr:alpha/beta fold hydrolase [Streptosporangiales bacterium]